MCLELSEIYSANPINSLVFLRDYHFTSFTPSMICININAQDLIEAF